MDEGGAEKREVKRDEGGEGGKKMARREERWGGEEEGEVHEEGTG